MLAAAAVHTHLVRNGLRSYASINVRCAEALDTHYFAVLIGVGATTVNAYLAEASIALKGREAAPAQFTAGGTLSATGEFTFTINGEEVSIGTTNAGSAAANGTAIAAAITSSSAAQAAGVTAAADGTGVITLTNSSGQNFTLGGTGLTSLGNMPAGATSDGVPASGTVTAITEVNAVKTIHALVSEINNDTDLKTKIRASNDA